MSNDLQQFQQKIWVKEQEISALKVQNRHLIAKLEEAEQGAKPNQMNLEQISTQLTKEIQNQIQQQMKAAQAQTEKSLSQAFEMMQATLRGVYQQSQRAQQAVDSLSEHSRDIEARTNESRKADQQYYQEKVFSQLTSFCDRVERQLEQRLAALGAVDHIVAKQNEALNDIESLKVIALSLQKTAEVTRNEITRVEKNAAETSQKLIEIEVQGRNSEEIVRDALQQINHHRTEFKLARGEIRSMIEHAQKLNEKMAVVDERIGETLQDMQLQQREQDRIRNELREIEVKDSLENLIEVKEEDISAIETAVEEHSYRQNNSDAGNENSPEKEDLVMILDLLKSQKSDLKRVAKDAEGYLKEYRGTATIHPINPDPQESI